MRAGTHAGAARRGGTVRSQQDGTRQVDSALRADVWHRIASTSRTAGTQGTRIRCGSRRIGCSHYSVDPCTSCCLFDVLHMMPHPDQDALLSDVVSALEPGGIILVREADASAGWRFQAVRFGNRLTALTSGAWRQRLRSARSVIGASASRDKVSRWKPHQRMRALLSRIISSDLRLGRPGLQPLPDANNLPNRATIRDRKFRRTKARTPCSYQQYRTSDQSTRVSCSYGIVTANPRFVHPQKVLDGVERLAMPRQEVSRCSTVSRDDNAGAPTRIDVPLSKRVRRAITDVPFG